MSGANPEIERKFLVRTLPDGLDAVPKTAIEQGYLAVDAGGTEVRLRKKGERRLLTVKSGAGLTRLEAEVELTSAQFQSLWPMTAGRRLKKLRHGVPYGALTVEVDVYSGNLSGLCVAEVEFESEGDARAFEPLSWFGVEVTGDPRYLNRTLALLGPPDSD